MNPPNPRNPWNVRRMSPVTVLWTSKMTMLESAAAVVAADRAGQIQKHEYGPDDEFGPFLYRKPDASLHLIQTGIENKDCAYQIV